MSEVGRLLVKRDEAAQMLGVPVSSFTLGVKAGQYPPPCRIGGSIRWRVTDIQAAKESGATKTFPRRPKSTALRPGVTHLYRHFDSDGRLLYVGISLSAIERLCKHRSESHWFWQIARIEVTAYATRASAMKAERISIQREKPLHNIVHAAKKAPRC